MSESEVEPITQEAALRVALAARALPNIALAQLVQVLHNRLGDHIDTDKLRTVTVTDLKTGLGSVDGEDDNEDILIGLDAMKMAVRILWGDDDGTADLPPVEPYADGDLPGSVRIALASDSGTTLNGHFGSCLRFLVYQVSPTESRLVGIRDAIEADFADDKNAFRTSLISDCHVLYVVSIGGPAAPKVIRADIYPIKRPEGGEAAEIIAQFQQAMVKSPPPWLSKILGVAAGQRVKNYDAGTRA